MPKPIRETRVLKLVFITIPCLKFWAQVSMYKVYRTIQYIVYILNHLSKCIMVILLCLDISETVEF